jgi:hypothetical protein
MLILNDSSDLGDNKLSPEEGVAKLKEGNKKLASAHKIPNQELLENKGMAQGVEMSPADLIRRIQKLNPNLLVEQGGIPNAVAVRKFALDEDGLLGKKYVTGFYVDRALPDFSSIIVDNNGLPKREIRGWRTVLLALMNADVLTYAQVKTEFGEPHGQRNSLWMEQTRDKRV